MTRVKICGLSRPQDVAYVNRARPDWCGFVVNFPKSRRSVTLEPMNPYERRIIHSTLQNDKFVFTRSEGEEPFRHVVVALKKEERRERRPRTDRRPREFQERPETRQDEA